MELYVSQPVDRSVPRSMLFVALGLSLAAMVQPFEVLTAATYSLLEIYCTAGPLVVPAWTLLWAFGLLLVLPGTAVLLLLAIGIARANKVAWAAGVLYALLNIVMGAFGLLHSGWPTGWKVGAGVWFFSGLVMIGLLLMPGATQAVWQGGPRPSKSTIPVAQLLAVVFALAVVAGVLVRLYAPAVNTGMPLVADRTMLQRQPEAVLAAPGAKAGFVQVIPGTFCQPDGVTSQKFATPMDSVATLAWYRQRLAALGWAEAPVTDPHYQVIVGRTAQYWFHRGPREWFGLIVYQTDKNWHFWDGSQYVPPPGWKTAFETQYWIEQPDRLLPPYNGNV